MHAAQTLRSFDFGEPEVEVEVAVAEEELDLSDFVMEEDAEMCAAARIPEYQNVTVKVCVITNNHGTVNF